MPDTNLPVGSIPNQPALGTAQSTDLVPVYRPSLGVNGMGQYTVSALLALGFPVGSITLDQLGPPVNDVDFGGQNAINLANPINAQDAATKTYVDSHAAGLQSHQAARVATTLPLPANTYNNGTLGVGATLTGSSNGALTVDTIAVAVNDRVLVAGESNAANNGVYTVTAIGSVSTPYVLTRSTDLDQGTEFPGAMVPINTGATNSGALFICGPSSAVTVGTTPIPWSELSIGTGYAPINSPAFTGTPTTPTPATADNSTRIPTTQYVQAQGFARLASPALTGIPTTPTQALTDNSTQIVNSAWVRGQGLATAVSPAFTGTPTVPTQVLTDNSTQIVNSAWVRGQGFAPIASPAFTGSPTSTTPTAGDNSTRIPTTAFIAAAIASLAPLASPAFTGTPTVPTPATTDSTTKAVNSAWVKSLAYAPLASPALTGTPTAPTPANTDNSTRIPTTAFVQALVAGVGTGAAPIILLANVAALRAGTSTTITQNVAFVEGYYSAGDQGGGIYVLGASSTDNGGTIINDGSARSWYLQLYGEPVSIKHFGARVDGSTNDTNACQAADTWSRANGSYPVLFPAGICMVNQLVVSTGSNWIGTGRSSSAAGAVSSVGSEIRQIIGSNTDLIYGNNSNANWGVTAATLQSSGNVYVDGYSLRNLTLNGNWNGGSGGNTVGSGLAVFGSKPILENVYITNCAYYGMRTGWVVSDIHSYPPQPPGFDLWAMEGIFFNVTIDHVGQYGWYNAGPHDSVAIKVFIIDASAAANGQYDAEHMDVGSGGTTHIGCHYWSRHSTGGTPATRTAYALNIASGPGFFHNCYFEGAYTPMRIASAGNRLTECFWQGAWSNQSIFLDAGAQINQINGTISSPAANNTNTVFGVVFGGSPTISDNNINLQILNNTAGVMYFNPGGNTGYNTIKIKAYAASTATYGGTPQSTDNIEIDLHNNNGQTIINTNWASLNVPQSSGVSLASTAPGIIGSFVLQPGTWEIWCTVAISNAGAISTVQQFSGGIGINSGTQGTTAQGLQNNMSFSNLQITGVNVYSADCGHTIQNLAAASTIYLIADANFAGPGLIGYGCMFAKRL